MPQALKLLNWMTSLSASGRKTVPVAEIERIVQGALRDTEGAANGDQGSALEQIEALANYLRNARAELAALDPSASGNQYQSATDELDEIVRAIQLYS